VKNNNIANHLGNNGIVNGSVGTVSIPKHLPQLVVYVDKNGMVLRCDGTLATDAFGSIKVDQDVPLHDLIHPGCDGGCRLLKDWLKAFGRLRTEKIVESEIDDVPFDRLLRFNILRSFDAADNPAYAVIAIVDITVGRDAMLTLQQLNRGLDKMFRSKASQLSKALDKADRDQQRILRMDERLRLLSSRLILAQEQERERISSDLHDGLGQRLSLARYSIEQCLDKIVSEGGAECSATSLRAALNYVEESFCEIRNVVQGLQPSMLEELGVTASLELLVREFELTYSGIHFNAEIESSDMPVSYDVSVAMYRIAQEALHNIVKHADASNVDFCLEISSRKIRLRIADNGRGLDCGSLDKPVSGKIGNGLTNIKKRAAATGGLFEIDSDADSGTRLSFVWQNDLT